MGCESSSSPSGKRSRDAEDEVYLDNFHSQKRYLSEVMASSLNGLTVGDTLHENLLESPARDDISLQYSPMSEDLDDARYNETHLNTFVTQPNSLCTSTVSPHRHQRPLSGLSSTTPTSSYPSHGCAVTAMTCSHTEGRNPSSPSDICHSVDLRRTALLRSVQMRTHPPGSPAFELLLSPGRELIQNIEAEEHSYPCETSMVMLESELSREKSCGAFNMNVKVEEPGQGACGGNERSLGGNAEACFDFD